MTSTPAAMSAFNTRIRDSQATEVEAMKPGRFPFDEYLAYEQQLSERCRRFWNEQSGVLVYRRMRVAEVFSTGCGDMRQSLEWQLGALYKSMDFTADIPNFLEPWYGIGTTASAFDLDYQWHPGQAPAIVPRFANVREALDFPVKEVRDTPIGRHTLDMIEHFLEQTGGRMPMSFCDIQSPFNVAPVIIDSASFFSDMLLDPERVKEVLDLLADLIIGFTKLQQSMLGDALVCPGHSFASSRAFGGFGMSEDNIVMIEPDLYSELVAPSFARIGGHFGGPVFHSCGDYSSKLEAVKSIPGLKMLDAAFSEETDPDPNPPAAFREAFRGTGVVVNARIVGGLETIEKTVRELWAPGMKMIVVTFCPDPQLQEAAYELVHEICQ